MNKRVAANGNPLVEFNAELKRINKRGGSGRVDCTDSAPHPSVRCAVCGGEGERTVDESDVLQRSAEHQIRPRLGDLRNGENRSEMI